MKTNRSARWIARIRTLSLCLALMAAGGIEFGVSESLAARIGQTTAHRTDNPQALNVCLSDLMAAAH